MRGNTCYWGSFWGKKLCLQCKTILIIVAVANFIIIIIVIIIIIILILYHTVHHHHVPEGHVILFLDPQDEDGPSISSSVVLCFFVLLVYIVVLVLVVCLCPSSVHVVGTFPGTVTFCGVIYVCVSSFRSTPIGVVEARITSRRNFVKIGQLAQRSKWDQMHEETELRR